MAARRTDELTPAETGRRIRDGAARLGVALDEAATADLVTYLELLHAWNQRLNLIGDHDLTTLVDRHLVDSLAAAPRLRELQPGARVADLGSGAGLPGIPLAIAVRHVALTLVEPRRKRANFLRAARRALPHLGMTVVEGRAEDLAQSELGAFDAVVSRAALPDAMLLPLAEALLREGGILVSYRGIEPPPDATAAQGDPGATVLSPPHDVAYRLDERHRPFHLQVRRRLRST